jgi:2,4-dienoyl-CoA reductase-like NADH-dependent reductase (Old Yellow Enzyme family)
MVCKINGAHGWLLSSFLSPHTNSREDEYGGSTDKRVSILKEIIEKAKEHVVAKQTVYRAIRAY